VPECTDSTWCEVTAVCSATDACPVEVQIVADRSTTADDAQSIAICPVGYVVSYCEVYTGLVHTESDGAHVDPNDASVCVAFNGNGGSGAIARALCTRNENVTDPCNNEGPDIPKFLNLHSLGSDPIVSCPVGYQQILCNARSPWLGMLTDKGIDANGVIPNDEICGVSDCSDSSWCEVTAVCTPTAVCSVEVEIVANWSSTEDDAQSRAICPIGFVVSYCEVETGLVHTESDGAHVDPSDARVCVAFNGNGGLGVVARALCSWNENVTDPCNNEGPDIPKFLSLHSQGSAPIVSCPLGYQQILCNARSPWLGLLTEKGINTNGVIPNNQSCTVPECTDSTWCEVTAVCSATDACPVEVQIVADRSTTADDAQSIAICPVGYVVSYCEVYTGLVHTESDGAHVDPNDASVCVAFNGNGGSGAIARALCTRNENVTDPCNNEGPDIPKFLNLHSLGSDPIVSCPVGYQQILCNARSPWLGMLTDKGIDANGVIPNDEICGVSDCSDSSWCEVTAVCTPTAVCSVEVEIVANWSSTEDDAQSRATCPVGFVVSYCEVETGLVHNESDGAHVDPSDARVCVAFNGNAGLGVVARALCSWNENVTDPCNSAGLDIPKFVHLHSQGSAPIVSCPLGYEQILCNARSPWLGLLTDKGVNSNGVIPNNQSCSVPECTDSNWCEVTAVCSTTDWCPAEVEIVADRSTTEDDAQSMAICPVGYVVSHCEVYTGLVHTESDGAHVDPSDASVCVAFNGNGGSGAIARALCTRNENVTNPCNNEGMDIPKFLNLHSLGTDPIVSCPLGYLQILCNARSPWSGLLTDKGINANGVIPNDQNCTVSECSESNWCEVTAVCSTLDSAEYKDVVCPEQEER